MALGYDFKDIGIYHIGCIGCAITGITTHSVIGLVISADLEPIGVCHIGHVGHAIIICSVIGLVDGIVASTINTHVCCGLV